MASPPSATPAPPKGSGPGCLVALVLFPVVVIGGLVLGTVLSPDDEPEGERTVTLDDGTIGDTAWRVDAVRDVEGDVCAFLYRDDEQLTGGCDESPQDATFDDETVVFGKAGDRPSVRVELDTGAVVEVDTVSAEGIDGRFYVTVVDGDVDADALLP